MADEAKQAQPQGAAVAGTEERGVLDQTSSISLVSARTTGSEISRDVRLPPLSTR